MQLALSRVHARLVPMRRGASGYEIDASAQGWFELPAGRGFAGYGLGRALRMLLDVLRGLTALHDTFDAVGETFAHGEVALPQFRVDHEGVCRLVPLATRHSAVSSAFPPETMGYLSPERLLGEQVDARADVFSAGVLLWEAMAGRRLFEESTVDAIIDRLMGEKLPMPQLPPELAWAIPLKAVAARALAVDPYQRFADCAELATAIAIVSRERVASHAEIASFFGAPPRSLERRLREGSSVTPAPGQRVVPSQSSTFPAVDSPTSSRRASTLAPLGPSRSLTPAPVSIRSAAVARVVPHKSPFSALIGAELRGEPLATPRGSATLTSLGTPTSVDEPAPASGAAPRSSSRPPPLPAWAQVPGASPCGEGKATLSALVTPLAASAEGALELDEAAVAFRRPTRRVWSMVALLSLVAIIVVVAVTHSGDTPGISTAAVGAPARVQASTASPLVQAARTASPAREISAGGATPPPATSALAPKDSRSVVPHGAASVKPSAPSKSAEKDYGI